MPNHFILIFFGYKRCELLLPPAGISPGSRNPEEALQQLVSILRKVLTAVIYSQHARKTIQICLNRGRMESLGNDDLSIVLLLIIIIIRSSSSYSRGHNLLKHFRKTQHKLIRLMNTSIASLPSLNVGFTSLLGHKRLPNQH